jgi:hypothetical protein
VAEIDLEGAKRVFGENDLHDWRVLEITIRYKPGDPKKHEVLLTVHEPMKCKDYLLTFGEVRGFRATIDLEAKLACRDAIQEMNHEPITVNSSFIDQLDVSYGLKVPNSDQLTAFVFSLCPPGGTIELLAKSVTMMTIAGPRTTG